MAFDANAVEEGIASTQFSGSVMHFPAVGSTNTLALEAAQAGARGGVWVADEQMAGRGRGGHGWHSAPGDGLYVSALITPSLPIKLALLLSLATGLAAKHSVAEVIGLDADIRWPNDLLLNSKKCGGILVETAVTAPNSPTAEAILRYAVIGVGINLNQKIFPDDIAPSATSLHIESKTLVSREAMLIALLRALDAELRLLTIEHDEQLLKRFADASTWVRGKRVRVQESGGYTGVTAGLDANGFLLVDSDDGVRRTVLSGGVREQ
jgi:BirA family biotin operon repressor/biotin-[acetyl-CoA-carboxylase] ligase